jgi:hypothetical protein
LLNLESRLAPSVTVLNANDSGAGSLRQAILTTNGAPGADTIDFDPTFFIVPRTINLTALSGQLSITDNLTINGPGSGLLTVNGGGGTRIFNVDKSGTVISVTISGMTVTGGNGSTGGQFPTAGDGGAIRTTDESLTLRSMVITGNAAGANDGGAIAATSLAVITVDTSTISGNTTNRSGGGIYFYSGGGLFVQNSTISGNTAGSTIAGGGGIYFFGTVAPSGFTIRNSTIAGNVATNASGGAMVFANLSGAVTIQNSTITNNSAGTTSTAPGTGGGGVAIISGVTAPTLNIQSSIISRNTTSAANGRSDLATIAAATNNVTNSAIGDPDGFALSGSSTGNLAYGAALNLLSLANYGGSTATVALGLDSLAVDAGSNPTNLTFDQRGSGHPRQVGAAVDIGAFEGTLDIPSAAAAGLVNVSVAGTNDPYTFNVTYSGATPIDTSTLDNNDVRITGPNGFNVLATKGAVDNSNPNAVVVTYFFAPPANPTTGWDNGDNGAYTVAMEPNQVANTSGGFVAPGTLGTFQVLIGQSFVVTNLNDGGPGSLRWEIGAANSDTIPDIITFQAGLTGTIAMSFSSTQMSITQSVTIVGPGASLVTIDAGHNLRIFDIDNLSAVINVSISGLTLTGGNGRDVNTGTNGVWSDGGAISTDDENLELDDMVITGNSTVGDNDGGGIAVMSSTNVVIRNCTISGNSTAGSGGGIYLRNGGSLLLENSTVSGNTSGDTNGGGGIYFWGRVASHGFTISNSTISGNSAAGSGGGLNIEYLNTVNAPIVIQNSTITGNHSSESAIGDGYGGGGISLGSVSLVTGATAVISLQNTIVSGNTSNVSNGNDDITLYSGALNANYCAIGDPDGFTLSGTSGHNLPFGAALHLQSLGNNGGPTQTIAMGVGSAAIDAGPTTIPGVPFDQRGAGFVRVSGPKADIGAFEVQGATGPTVTEISINGGAQERSHVTTVDVTFSTVVTFAGPVANAFTFTRNGGGAVGGFSATANVVNGVTVVTLNNFTGAETEFGSLVDGRFTLTVLANQVSAGGVNMASNAAFTDTNGLFRLFGDVNGDQTVNGLDLGFFRNAFGTQTGDANYLSYLDLNGDGVINGFDLGQFRTRFGTVLP